MGCDAVIAKTQSGSLPPPRGKARMGVGLMHSQAPPSSPRPGWGTSQSMEETRVIIRVHPSTPILTLYDFSVREVVDS